MGDEARAGRRHRLRGGQMDSQVVLTIRPHHGAYNVLTIRPHHGPCERGTWGPATNAHTGARGRSTHTGRAGLVRRVDAGGHRTETKVENWMQFLPWMQCACRHR